MASGYKTARAIERWAEGVGLEVWAEEASTASHYIHISRGEEGTDGVTVRVSDHQGYLHSHPDFDARPGQSREVIAWLRQRFGLDAAAERRARAAVRRRRVAEREEELARLRPEVRAQLERAKKISEADRTFNRLLRLKKRRPLTVDEERRLKNARDVAWHGPLN